MNISEGYMYSLHVWNVAKSSSPKIFKLCPHCLCKNNSTWQPFTTIIFLLQFFIWRFFTQIQRNEKNYQIDATPRESWKPNLRWQPLKNLEWYSPLNSLYQLKFFKGCLPYCLKCTSKRHTYDFQDVKCATFVRNFYI